MKNKNSYINIHSHQSNSELFTIYNLGANFSEIKNHNALSIGIHPWHIDEEKTEEQLELLKKYSSEKNVLAIGECGLDKMIETNLKSQEIIFKQQILIAEQVKKPLIIHCVKAFDDLIRIKKEMKIAVPMIIHGFNNNKQIAEQLIKNDFYFSFGKALLKNDSNASNLISYIPKEKIFLETDNSNFTIQEIYNIAAQLMNIELEKLKEIIFNNYKTIF